MNGATLNQLNDGWISSFTLRSLVRSLLCLIEQPPCITHRQIARVVVVVIALAMLHCTSIRICLSTAAHCCHCTLLPRLPSLIALSATRNLYTNPNLCKVNLHSLFVQCHVLAVRDSRSDSSLKCCSVCHF
jgi:hypothetical protein